MERSSEGFVGGKVQINRPPFFFTDPNPCYTVINLYTNIQMKVFALNKLWLQN